MDFFAWHEPSCTAKWTGQRKVEKGQATTWRQGESALILSQDRLYTSSHWSKARGPEGLKKNANRQARRRLYCVDRSDRSDRLGCLDCSIGCHAIYLALPPNTERTGWLVTIS